MIAHFILYVADQKAARLYYETVLGMPATLDEPGMTELTLAHGCILGLMPLTGIARLLGDALIEPSASAPPRSELYLRREDAAGCFARALENGAVEISPMQKRDWGDVAGYVRDPDGHVVAFGWNVA